MPSSQGSGGEPAWLRGTETAARWTRWLLYGLTALAGLFLLVDFFGYDLAATASSGRRVSQDDAEFLDSALQTLSTWWLVIYLATVIAFLVWFRKSHENLPRLGIENTEHSPGWAVGGFFVPILNLFRPYQVAREIAKASSSAPPAGGSWKETETPSVVKWWWGLFLVSNWISWRTFTGSPDEAATAADLEGWFALDAASNAASIAAAVAAVQMVNFIVAEQKSASKQDDRPREVSPRTVFEQRPGWGELPNSLLDALAERLRSAEDVRRFISIAERSGMFERKLRPLPAGGAEDFAFTVNMIASMLTSYANACGERGQIGEAREGLELALQLNPYHVPAWSSMAITEFYSDNCDEAVRWARRVLSFEPSEDADDPWQAGLASAMTPEGEREAAEALGDPSLLGTSSEIEQMMREIIARCEG